VFDYLFWQNEAKMLNVFNEQSDGLCALGITGEDEIDAPDLAAPTDRVIGNNR
jgi:hypothetical protein